MDSAVATYRLTKRFGETVALDDVTLGVEEGSVCGLLGRNGAGKTTLMRILFGLLRPDAGSVRLFGREAQPGDVEARRDVAGFVEEPRFYPHLTARRNLELLARLDGRSRADRVDDALDLLGLEQSRDERAGNFSTGMRQRLGLAAALLRSPRLLVLDEPTLGLDPASAHLVRGLIRELAAHGATVFVSSHDMSEVDEICDGVIVIARGRVVWDGSLDRLRREAPAPLFFLTTSDDDFAFAIASALDGVDLERTDGGRLRLRADDDVRDELVVALGRAGVVVRRLEPDLGPLDALFVEMTGPA